MNESLSVIGLGKLGVPYLVHLASLYNVIAYDLSPEIRENLINLKSNLHEAEIDELLLANQSRISIADTLSQAVKKSSVSFVILPTPSMEDGSFSFDALLTACKAIAEAVKEKKELHSIVIVSTVMPGDIEDKLYPVLQDILGNDWRANLAVFYSPSFISLGNVLKDLREPSFILWGENPESEPSNIPELLKKCCKNSPPVQRMSIINAEITKISLNSFLITKISFANMLARICERVPGANVDLITSALGQDRRIAPGFLKGAIGFGGPCFPRDSKAFLAFSGKYQTTAKIVSAADQTNQEQYEFLVNLVKMLSQKYSKVAILGISYKPETNVATESHSLRLMEDLITQGVEVHIYDPAFLEPESELVQHEKLIWHKSLSNCLSAGDLILISTPWQEFKSINNQMLGVGDKCLVDCWRILDVSKFSSNHKVIQLGVHS